MQKILTVPREDRCIGCMLCCIKASLLKSKKIDFNQSFIKVVKVEGAQKYKVIIDYGASIEVEEIIGVCPRKCFEIKEREGDE